MLEFCLISRNIFLFVYFVHFSIFPFVNGKIENSFQNSPQIQMSNQKSHHFDSTILSRSYDGFSSKMSSVVDQPASSISGTPETAQAVVAVVSQSVNGKHAQQLSSERIRSNSHTVLRGNRRCTYFQNGDMRCTSRGDVLDNVSSFINQAVSLANQLGGLAGLMGLLGLKGLAGLILPLLCLFLLKFWLILLPLKLLLPIPIITLPVAGRRNLESSGFAEVEEKITTAFEKLISSDKVVEKM